MRKGRLREGMALNLARRSGMADIGHCREGHPALAHADPYGQGWLIRIRSADAGSSPHAVQNPIEWLRAQGEAMKDFFLASSAQPGFATLQDGGEPVEGILQACDAGVWKSFNETFAALRPLEAVDAAREMRQ